MNYFIERTQRQRSRSRERQQVKQYRISEGRWKLEQTKTLMFEGVDIIQEDVESMFMDLSITLGTSVPNDVEIINEKCFVRYPSVEAAVSIFEKAKGQIQINGHTCKLQYWPIKKIDLSLAYDWYCEACGYKNFGRRGRCNRCDTQKSQNSRLSYSNQPAVRPARGDETPQNCSLMLRGPIITEMDEATLLESFEKVTSVKDIRQIRNRICGGFKDYAFIQFFTPEDTTAAFEFSNQPEFRLKGQRVTVMYSRNRADDDYVKPLPYEKRERRNRDKPREEDNYYHRQRQKEIEQQRAQPTITMQQLKEKHEQEMKRKQPVVKEMTAQQSKRRQAEQLAKQWQKEMKVVATMYLCPICRRKFASLEQMKLHETTSELHKYHMAKFHSTALAL